MASKGIMFSNGVTGERVRVRVTVVVSGLAKVYRVWVWRRSSRGSPGWPALGWVLVGLSAPRQARGCRRSSWPAEGKPRPAAAQSGLRASQALPAGRGRKSGHGQGRDEPTAEPPANRAEVDVKRMFNEPVQRQVTTKTSVMRHGDVGNGRSSEAYRGYQTEVNKARHAPGGGAC